MPTEKVRHLVKTYICFVKLSGGGEAESVCIWKLTT